MNDLAGLAAAWKRWDANPKGAYEANRLEDEVQMVATEMGIAGSELRRRIVALREQGAGVIGAIRRVCE